MNEVINQVGVFHNNVLYYTDTISLHIHKTYWYNLVDNDFVDKSLGSDKNDYGISGIFYAWFLAPKVEYCLVIDDFGFMSPDRTFKGYSEEDRMIKLNEFISLLERKTVSGRFPINWTTTSEGL